MRLTGPVQDMASRAAIESFASALFGHDRVTNADRRRSGAAGGLAGPGARRGRGAGGAEGGQAQGDARRRSRSRAGGSTSTSRTRSRRCSRRRSASTAPWSTSPSTPKRPRPPRWRRGREPEICADQIGAILEAGSIQFAAGSADHRAGEPRGDRRDRRRAARLPRRRFRDRRPHRLAGPGGGQQAPERRPGAGGPGGAATPRTCRWCGSAPAATAPTRPIADNASDAGRANNRRIEFTLRHRPASPTRPAASRPDDGEADAIEAAEACAAEIARHPGRGLDPVRRRLGDDRAGERAGDRSHRAMCWANCPDAGVRDRRAHRFAGLGDGQPAAERSAGAGGADGAAVGRPAAARRLRARLRRERAGRRQRHRRRAGRRTGASPSRWSPEVAEGDLPEGDDPVRGLQRPHRRDPRRTATIQFAAGSATLAPESAPVIDDIARGAAELPGRRARDRRPHRFARARTRATCG